MFEVIGAFIRQKARYIETFRKCIVNLRKELRDIAQAIHGDNANRFSKEIGLFVG